MIAVCKMVDDMCDTKVFCVELVGDGIGEADIMPSIGSWRPMPSANMMRGAIRCLGLSEPLTLLRYVAGLKLGIWYASRLSLSSFGCGTGRT